jgi:hypothetical protein
MLPWITIRRALTVLLLLPLVHFAYIVAGDFQKVLNLSPTTWENEVVAYEALDRNSAPPRRPLLVLGGRQAGLWNSLPHTLFPMPVLNRALGDANLNDIDNYLDRIANPYKPMAVILIPSSTNFVIRADKSAEQFMQNTASICAKLQLLLTKPHCYVMSLPKWPAYPDLWNRVDRANELLSYWTDANENASLIDARPILEDADGQTIGAHFRNDGHNLNDWGMEKIDPLIRQQVEKDFSMFF